MKRHTRRLDGAEVRFANCSAKSSGGERLGRVAGTLGMGFFAALLLFAPGCGERPEQTGPEAALERLDIPPTDLIADFLARRTSEAPDSEGGLAPPDEAVFSPEIGASEGSPPRLPVKGTWLNLEPSQGTLVSVRTAAPPLLAMPREVFRASESALADEGAAGQDLEVLFDKESELVAPTYYDALARLARRLREQPGTKVLLEGYADNRGSVEYNRTLSLRRAKAVAKLLTERQGVEPSRVSAVGLGEENPVADNLTAEGRARNRRVVAVLEGS